MACDICFVTTAHGDGLARRGFIVLLGRRVTSKCGTESQVTVLSLKLGYLDLNVDGPVISKWNHGEPKPKVVPFV